MRDIETACATRRDGLPLVGVVQLWNMNKKAFDSWNKVKKLTDSQKRPLVKIGEVYWCRVGENVGFEENGKGECFRRPVLVLAKFSREVVFGVPLTSKAKQGSWYVNYMHKGVPVAGIINQSRAIDVRRFENFMYQAPDHVVENIRKHFIELIS